MTNFFQSILQELIYISLICSLLLLLLNKNKYIKSLNYIVGIILLLSIVSVMRPLFSIMSEIINIDFEERKTDTDYEDGFNEAFISQTAANISAYTKTILLQKYGIEENLVTVSVTLDKENLESITINKVVISIKKDIPLDLATEIADFISNLMSCECMVVPI